MRLPFTDLFRRNAPAKPTAVSEVSAMYSSSDFTKYNPDDLIGRRGFAIYKKMMQDNQVKAAVKFKRDATTSRDYFFAFDDDSELSQEEQEFRVALFTAMLRDIRGSFMDVLNYIMSAMYNGFSVTEKLYGKFEYGGRTWLSVNAFKLRPFNTFYFDVDEFGTLKRFYQKVGTKEINLDPSRFIHYVVNPELDEHYGQSELRECYREWFSKDHIIKFRNIWLERHAGGFRWIKPTGNKTVLQGTPEFNQIMDVLNNMQTSTGILLPSDLEMSSDYPANTQAFKEAIEDYDMAIARAILIPNLLGVSPQGKFGSQAQAGTQFESFLWTLEADARRLEDVLNEQLFRQLGQWNFADGQVPRFRFKPVSESKKHALLELWSSLVGSNAVTHTDTDEAHIRELLSFPAPGDAVQPGTASSPEQGQRAEEPLPNEQVEQKKDETIAGRGVARVSSYSVDRALERVDFTVIAKRSEDVTAEYIGALAAQMGTLVQDVVSKASQLKTFNDEPGTIGDLSVVKFDSKELTRLRNIVKKSLRAAWAIGTRHATDEISKAKGAEFRADMRRLDFIESKFFDIKSFAVTAKLTDDAIAIIRNVILNAAKGGKTFQETEAEIYRAFVREGQLTMEQVPAELKAKLVTDLEIEKGMDVNKPHRMQTLIRTNTFEAINEARYEYFTDPALGGFVRALEYSAILDSRTTQICTHLDGHVHGADSEVWESYRPPNHYNCRSLLIPVTENDTWAESDPPSIEPQKGFN